MKDNVQFYILNSHSVVDLQRLTVVPENTFVIYTGSSGFSTYLATKRNMKSNGVMNFDKLVAPDYYDGATAAEKEGAYWSALFRNFFQGEYDLFRMYPGMQIYCPGDIIQMTDHSFEQSASTVLAYNGLYTLPMEPAAAERMSFHEIGPRRNFMEISPLYILLSRKGGDPEFQAAFERAGPKAHLRDFLEELATQPSIEEFIKFYESKVKELELPRFINASKMGAFFEDLKPLEAPFARWCYENPDNILIREGICANSTSNVFLSSILFRAGTAPRRSKYRFFILTGCRNPIGSPSMVAPNINVESMTPYTLPPNTDPRRSLTRRLSFSAKEGCAIGRTPPLNIRPLAALLRNAVARKKAIQDIAAFQTSIRAQNRDHKSYEEPLVKIFANMDRGFFMIDGETVGFRDLIGTYSVAALITRILEPSLFLASESPEYRASREYAQQLIQLCREIFGRFMVELRKGAEGQEAEAIGNILLTLAKHPDRIFMAVGNSDRFTKTEKEWFGEVIEREKAELAETTARMRKEAAEKALRDEYKDKDDTELDILLIKIKGNIEIIKLFNGFIAPAIGKHTDKNDLAFDEKILSILKEGKLGSKDVAGFDVINSQALYDEFKEKIATYKAKYNELPEAAGVLKELTERLEEYEKLRENYIWFLGYFEKRVGRRRLTERAEKERAARKLATRLGALWRGVRLRQTLRGRRNTKAGTRKKEASAWGPSVNRENLGILKEFYKNKK